jgi:penicillin-binding protein 2
MPIPEKYRIKSLEDSDINPEDTLADGLSGYSAIEVPIGRRVFGFFYVAISLLLFFIVLKSFKMQIVDGQHYSALADRRNASEYSLSSLRGIIYDSAGKPMVENLPVFDLIAVHSYLPAKEADMDEVINKVASGLGVPRDDLSPVFKENKDRSSFLIKRNISKEEIMKVKTLAPQGIFAVANSQRHYLDGPGAAHLLGYTALATQEDLKSDEYYFLNDRVGRLGLEAQYEKDLRGEHRTMNLSDKDASVTSQPGNNLYLNINKEIQNRLYKTISEVFKSAGVRRGAAVIQNTKTGAVLGIVSMPSFDPNVFENSYDPGSAALIPQIVTGNDKPLLDRAIGGRYSPGSTIKPLLALAGLKEGVVTPSTIINSEGSISVKSEVDPSVSYTFRDWKVHGLTDLRKAIANSVDVYFYALGGGYGGIKGLGVDKITDYFKKFLADKPTGIDLPGELSGFVPTREWKKSTKGESWYVGDTYNISIGQGDLIVTPLWINTYIGSLANGGKLLKPFIVKEVKDPDGKVVERMSPVVLGEIPFDQKTINLVKDGMRETVLSGTATMLKDLPVQMAAKTGTAQISKGLNSLFTVFGPYDDPEVVMTVLVENINQSQGVAIRVANDFLMWYFNEFKSGVRE